MLERGFQVQTLERGRPLKTVSESSGSGCTSSQTAFHPVTRLNCCVHRPPEQLSL